MTIRRNERLQGIMAVVAAAALALMTARALSAEEQRPMAGSGSWEKRTFKPDASAGACEQTWICVPDGLISMKSGESLELSPDAATAGTCKAIGADGCRACEAPAPTQACSWTIKAPETD